MSYNTAALRKLLINAFGDEELSFFSHDYFRPVYEKFAAGQTKTARVQLLIDYAEQTNRLDELVALVSAAHPSLYAQYEPRLNGAPQPSIPETPAAEAAHHPGGGVEEPGRVSLVVAQPGDRQVVLLVHGIRTHANWQEMVVEQLAEKNSITVIPVRYGYLDLFRFWFPWLTRERPIQKTLRRIRAAISRHPHARLSIIAHSFGTYAITKILDDNPDIKVFRLILCGSIVPTEFRWDKITGDQIHDPVINECGARDIWPVVAQATTWGYGASGTFGFGSAAAGVEDRFHNYRHSDYFTPEFVEHFWKPYIERGEITKSAWGAKRPPPPWWLDILGSLLNKYIFIILVLILLVSAPLL
ncbi:MAG: hypothetical protein M3390_20145, partial [Chloroflexota bacterium]|nr:hypothetical protein [Chloroflexota bacterium]